MTTSFDIFTSSLPTAGSGGAKTDASSRAEKNPVAASSPDTTPPTRAPEVKESFKDHMVRESHRANQPDGTPRKTEGNSQEPRQKDQKIAAPSSETKPDKTKSANTSQENNGDGSEITKPTDASTQDPQKPRDDHAQHSPDLDGQDGINTQDKATGQTTDYSAVNIPLSETRANGAPATDPLAPSPGSDPVGPSDIPDQGDQDYTGNLFDKSSSPDKIFATETPLDIAPQVQENTGPSQDVSSEKLAEQPTGQKTLPVDEFTTKVERPAVPATTQEPASTQDNAHPTADEDTLPTEAGKVGNTTDAAEPEISAAPKTTAAAATTAPIITPEVPAGNADSKSVNAAPETSSVATAAQAATQTPLTSTAAQQIPQKEINGKGEASDTQKTGARDNTVTGTGGSQSAAASAQPSSDQSSQQNSTGENTSPAAGVGKSTTQGGADMTAPKVPFATDLTQALTPETKPLQSGTPQQHLTGLLSVQEVGQPGSLTPGHVKSAAHHPMPNSPAEQIKLAISRQASLGQNSFRLSLKPAELGQVDIKMDFQADGRMTTTITVDNEKTLNMLQKDQSGLERALNNAGFDASGNNLNFTLKKQQQDHMEKQLSQTNLDGTGETDEGVDINLANSVISQQQLKMAYSKNALDINI
ncbi:flagellar hook-length control protein FliK [Paremcibacter congregatus]|uniref:Flagellar hook-length control protein-like C-terminal domain-containing protein n=1 Tax=Paremcibacter congregatus TaxID=2043170 RepID=A0A2G4YSF8_9PROT|nr:flagellar hook-length control protein FliK [Paremcibacter congregatus]PHZ85265.1 hypothetical protein CRD36_07620 [Paremcibacter congregatus]QDE27803.1 hypothetical protein FIV45_11215 [Paremcibacter congregatus]